MLITIGEAVAYVVSGMYGDVRELGAASAIIIIVQVSMGLLCNVIKQSSKLHKQQETAVCLVAFPVLLWILPTSRLLTVPV